MVTENFSSNTRGSTAELSQNLKNASAAFFAVSPQSLQQRAVGDFRTRHRPELFRNSTAATLDLVRRELFARQTLYECFAFTVRPREFHGRILASLATISSSKVLDALGFEAGQDLPGPVRYLARQAGELRHVDAV